MSLQVLHVGPMFRFLGLRYSAVGVPYKLLEPIIAPETVFRKEILRIQLEGMAKDVSKHSPNLGGYSRATMRRSAGYGFELEIKSWTLPLGST